MEKINGHKDKGNKRIRYSQREEVQGGGEGGKKCNGYCDSEGWDLLAPTTLNNIDD